MLWHSTTDRNPADPMRRPKLSALAVPLLVISLAACGGGKKDSPADVKAKVADQLQEQGLSKADATCFADIVVDDVGVATIKDFDFSADKPPAGHEQAFATASLKAITTCKITPSSLGG